MPSTDPTPPRGLRYGSQGPVTIRLGALPRAEPIRKPPAPAARPSSLAGSLLPGGARAFGPLPSPPRRTPPAPVPVAQTVALPEPTSAQGAPPAPGLAVEPTATASTPAAEPARASAPSPAAPRPVRRSGLRPALMAVGALGVAVAGVGYVASTRTVPEPGGSTRAAAAAPDGRESAPGAFLPSERAESTPPARQAAATARVARAPSRPPASTAASAAVQASPAAPALYAEVEPPVPVTSLAPVIEPETSLATAAVVPAEIARPRPPADPEAPFTTAPAGLRADR